MSPDFQQLMRQATQLTRSGNLAAAQALLQEALRGGAPHAAHPPSPRRTTPRHADMAQVIDVVAQVLPDVSDSELLRQAKAEVARNPLRNPSPNVGMSSGSHSGAGLRCDYELFVPPQAQSGRLLPLVLMLHGCTQNPLDFAAGTGMNDLAQAQGVIVVYPAQSQKMNPQRCWNWFKHNHQARGRGEPALLASLVEALIRQHPVDPRRVYVAGLSAGGAMAAILAETYPELFAAAGVHSGLAAGSAADLPSALSVMKSGNAGRSASKNGRPVIVFHGDADATVHPRNGVEVVARCTAVPGDAQPIKARRAGGRSATRYVHRGPEGKVLAEHWVVHGAGHAWSGGSAAGTYTDDRGPDASAEMLRFFSEHPQD